MYKIKADIGPPSIKLKTHKTILYSLNKANNFSRIAAFDLDGVIIRPKSGRVFPKDKDDWMFWNENVVPKIRELNKNHHRIVIFSNQSKIDAKDKTSVSDFSDKLTDIQAALAVDFDVFIALGKDYFRKPMTGMWDYFTSIYSVEIDMKKSFYCGDAAGREKNWMPGKKKDHSNSDRNFAHNIGLKFEIPENVFCSPGSPSIKYHVTDLHYLGIDLKELTKKKQKIVIPYTQKGQELVLITGRQGSGKTELSNKILKIVGYKDYVYISNDVCKTKAKCLKLAKTHLLDGDSILVDNTNPDRKSRADYIKLAKDINKDVYVTVYLVDIPEILSKHMDHFRVQKSQGELRILPNVVYHVYNKKYEKPIKGEGIDNIVKIPFSFEGTKDDEKIFLHHYSF